MDVLPASVIISQFQRINPVAENVDESRTVKYIESDRNVRTEVSVQLYNKYGQLDTEHKPHIDKMI